MRDTYLQTRSSRAFGLSPEPNERQDENSGERRKTCLGDPLANDKLIEDEDDDRPEKWNSDVRLEDHLAGSEDAFSTSLGELGVDDLASQLLGLDHEDTRQDQFC